ncbi:MAG: hypothetical protein HYS07_01275 [Chlamydiae bacterium]|nr:hypothetical protein [Chlamydiota bacterium]
MLPYNDFGNPDGFSVAKIQATDDFGTGTDYSEETTGDDTFTIVASSPNSDVTGFWLGVQTIDDSSGVSQYFKVQAVKVLGTQDTWEIPKSAFEAAYPGILSEVAYFEVVITNDQAIDPGTGENATLEFMFARKVFAADDWAVNGFPVVTTGANDQGSYFEQAVTATNEGYSNSEFLESEILDPNTYGYFKISPAYNHSVSGSMFIPGNKDTYFGHDWTFDAPVNIYDYAIDVVDPSDGVTKKALVFWANADAYKQLWIEFEYKSADGTKKTWRCPAINPNGDSEFYAFFEGYEVDDNADLNKDEVLKNATKVATRAYGDDVKESVVTQVESDLEACNGDATCQDLIYQNDLYFSYAAWGAWGFTGYPPSTPLWSPEGSEEARRVKPRVVEITPGVWHVIRGNESQGGVSTGGSSGTGGEGGSQEPGRGKEKARDRWKDRFEELMKNIKGSFSPSENHDLEATFFDGDTTLVPIGNAAVWEDSEADIGSGLPGLIHLELKAAKDRNKRIPFEPGVGYRLLEIQAPENQLDLTQYVAWSRGSNIQSLYMVFENELGQEWTGMLNPITETGAPYQLIVPPGFGPVKKVSVWVEASSDDFSVDIQFGHEVKESQRVGGWYGGSNSWNVRPVGVGAGEGTSERGLKSFSRRLSQAISQFGRGGSTASKKGQRGESGFTKISLLLMIAFLSAILPSLAFASVSTQVAVVAHHSWAIAHVLMGDTGFVTVGVTGTVALIVARALTSRSESVPEPGLSNIIRVKNRSFSEATDEEIALRVVIKAITNLKDDELGLEENKPLVQEIERAILGMILSEMSFADFMTSVNKIVDSREAQIEQGGKKIEEAAKSEHIRVSALTILLMANSWRNGNLSLEVFEGMVTSYKNKENYKPQKGQETTFDQFAQLTLADLMTLYGGEGRNHYLSIKALVTTLEKSGLGRNLSSLFSLFEGLEFLGRGAPYQRIFAALRSVLRLSREPDNDLAQFVKSHQSKILVIQKEGGLRLGGKEADLALGLSSDIKGRFHEVYRVVNQGRSEANVNAAPVYLNLSGIHPSRYDAIFDEIFKRVESSHFSLARRYKGLKDGIKFRDSRDGHYVSIQLVGNVIQVRVSNLRTQYHRLSESKLNGLFTQLKEKTHPTALVLSDRTLDLQIIRDENGKIVVKSDSKKFRSYFDEAEKHKLPNGQNALKLVRPIVLPEGVTIGNVSREKVLTSLLGFESVQAMRSELGREKVKTILNDVIIQFYQHNDPAVVRGRLGKKIHDRLHKNRIFKGVDLIQAKALAFAITSSERKLYGDLSNVLYWIVTGDISDEKTRLLIIDGLVAQGDMKSLVLAKELQEMDPYALAQLGSHQVISAREQTELLGMRERAKKLAQSSM